MSIQKVIDFVRFYQYEYGKTIADLAHELQISRGMIYYWMRKNCIIPEPYISTMLTLGKGRFTRTDFQ